MLFSPLNPVSAGRDTDISKYLFISQDVPVESVGFTVLFDIHNNTLLILEKNKGLPVLQRHHIQDFSVKTLLNLRHYFLFRDPYKIQFILGTATLTQQKKLELVVFPESIFPKNAPEILAVGRNDPLIYKFTAPDRIDAV
jgi:hypothetical protein